MNRLKSIKSALISVYYKEGLAELVQELHKNKVLIYSTGGTQTFIESLKIPVISVETLTNFPEILGGRVKTLHPTIFGGILNRRNLESDKEAIQKHGIPEIDLVIVDLYPFEETVAAGGRVDQGVVIAEGMVDFDYEITLLTVRAKDSKGVITTHYCEPIGHRQENGDYVESWQPQPMSDNALLKSKEMAKKVTDALGGLGLFGVELFIKGDEVLFSEASPRPHDTGMVTMMTQRQSEFELHAKAILGLPVDTQLINPGASAVIYGNLDAEAIMFEGVDKALAIKGVDVRLFGKPQSFKKRRMGVVLAEGKDISEARSKAQQAQALIKTKVQ